MSLEKGYNETINHKDAALSSALNEKPFTRLKQLGGSVKIWGKRVRNCRRRQRIYDGEQSRPFRKLH